MLKNSAKLFKEEKQKILNIKKKCITSKLYKKF